MQNLYDQDFNLWIEHTKERLIAKDFGAVDWDNLIDEIDDMGASHKRALDSYLQRLIEHILKLRYWSTEIDRCSNGWKSEVSNFRNRINRILRKNPSLKNYLKDEYADIYQDAKKNMSFNFEIPEGDFIDSDILMQDDFFG